MTDKEKEAIEILKGWMDYNKRNKNKLLKADEIIEVQETVLNLIQTQQEEIENLKYRKERQLIRFSKYKENIENKHEEIYEDLVQELEKKDKTIDLMANFILVMIPNHKYDKPTPALMDIDWVKEYFINKVKKENTDET